jgi:hypothetical protein
MNPHLSGEIAYMKGSFQTLVFHTTIIKQTIQK